MSVRTYLEAISDGLRDEMRRDRNVILLGEDIATFGGAFKITRGFLEEFGADRVIDTPISESGFVGAASAAAIEGLRPVVEFQFADFIACAFDQIVNYAAKAHYRWGTPVPVVFRGPAGGGFRGGPFHSQNPEAWFTHVPGLKVVQPSTPYDAKGLLKAAIRDNNPVIYFEHKHLYRRIREDVPGRRLHRPAGRRRHQARRPRPDDRHLRRDGARVSCRRRAAVEGRRECEVIDLRSLCPLDKDSFLTSVRKTSRALVVYEAHLTGGFGGEVAAIIAQEAFDALDAPVTRVASLDVPVPFAGPLEDAVLPNAEKIYRAAVDVLEY